MTFGVEFFNTTVEFDSFAVEYSFSGIGNAHNLKLQSLIAEKSLLLAGKLLKQVTPNVANSNYENVKHLGVREKKTVVNYISVLFSDLIVL